MQFQGVYCGPKEHRGQLPTTGRQGLNVGKAREVGLLYGARVGAGKASSTNGLRAGGWGQG